MTIFYNDDAESSVKGNIRRLKKWIFKNFKINKHLDVTCFLDLQRSERSVPHTISGNLSVKCVSLLCCFILTSFYWRYLSLTFDSCLSSFGVLQCFCFCRILTFSCFSRTAADQWSFKDVDEPLLGLSPGPRASFPDIISSADVWKVRDCLGKVCVHWRIDSCNIPVRFWSVV